MITLSFLGAFLAAAALFRPITVAVVSDVATTLLERVESQTTVLAAISVRSQLDRREVDVAPRYTCEHHYVDHVSLLRGGSARFAKTSIRFKLPAVALEDIETHLESIECSGSIIVLEFTDERALSQAKRDWDGLSEFIVVSSHPGCNRDGERAPYMVSSITYNTDRTTASFLVHSIEWEEAFVSMQVDFGMTDTSPSSEYSISGIRSHERLDLRLRRRQAATSSTSAHTTITFPSAPTSTPSSESSVKNLNFSSTDTSILSIEEFTIGCNNCTVMGVLDITQGTFTVNSSTRNAFEEAAHFIESGFFNVVTNGFRAHMDLAMSVSLTASLPFTQYIFQMALPGFQIPGIATVGPQVDCALIASIEISNPIHFTYGFDLTVPDGSSISLSIGNLTNSSSQGFSNPSISALPFAASSDGVTVTLALGLRTELLLGVSLLSGSGDMHAGMFLDLPALSVAISPLSSVNADCEPLTSSNATNSLLSYIFPNLMHVVPLANIDIGVEAGATLRLPDLTSVATEGSTSLTGTSFTLPTACLSWDSRATAFVEPSVSSSTTVAPAATGDGSGSGGPKKNSGTWLRHENPFVLGTSRVWAMVVLLGCTLLVFSAL